MAPATCWQIPSHVTALYVYAVINLSLLLNITFTEANILVLDRSNRTIGKIEHEYEAKFGPDIPPDGVWGHIAYTHPDNGCSEIQPPPVTSTEWIAVIKRGACDFDQKVLNAQDAGYIAAIVFNNESDDLVPMGGGKKGDEVTIPSVFIGISDAEYLVENFDRSIEYSVLLDDESPFSLQLYLVPFAIVVAICFVLMLVFMLVKWIRDFNKRRRSRLSKSHLKKIPVKKFKKGDDYDICAICIDEYEEGEKLRILPCSHAYHQKCIDPWLTKNKKTCPICKRKVIPGREGTSDSESSDESDDDDVTQPLLPAQDLRRSGGGTFDNSGLPETLRSHIMRLPELSSDSAPDSDVDTADDLAASALHHSSVEVHSDTPRAPAPLVPAPETTRYTLMDETAEVQKTSSAAIDDNHEDDDGTASEAASSVGIFGTGGAETEEDDEVLLEDAIASCHGVNRALNIAEDHFQSEDGAEAMVGATATAEVEDEPLGLQDHEEAATGSKKQEDEVQVVSGSRRNKRKKKSNRKRDENA